MSGQPAPETDMTIDRVEAFSDGVFSVAVTLLILNLQPPHLVNADPASALIDGLLSQWPSYVSYVIAFLTLGAVWISHHRMLRYIENADPTLQTLNVLFLMFITLTPFTTALLGQYIQQPNKLPIALAAYGFGWAFNGLCLNLLWIYAVRNGMLKASVTPTMIRDMRLSTSIGSTFGFFAALLALFLPSVSLLIYSAMVIGYTGVPLSRVFRRPSGQPSSTAAGNP